MMGRACDVLKSVMPAWLALFRRQPGYVRQHAHEPYHGPCRLLKPGLGGGAVGRKADDDSNGAWANHVRAYEEERE